MRLSILHEQASGNFDFDQRLHDNHLHCFPFTSLGIDRYHTGVRPVLYNDNQEQKQINPLSVKNQWNWLQNIQYFWVNVGFLFSKYGLAIVGK